MERILVSELSNKIEEKVKISGWAKVVRDHGKITFIDLVDRSGLVQAVGQNLPKISVESAIEIEGVVKKRPEKLVNPKLDTGEIEVEIIKLTVLSAAWELPFDMSKEDLDLELPTLLDWRSLTMKHPKQKAIFKVEACIIDAFREALKKKDFTEFQAPSIIASIPEGGAEVFEVKYFDYKTYLAQSAQLYKQIMTGIYERVFSVNKVFRAEPSVTTRHLTEIVGLDAEMGFIDSWLDVVDMAEYTIKYIFDSVEKNCGDELKLLDASLPKVSAKIPRVKLREAQEIIYKRTGVDHRKEKDLAPEDEREICAWAKDEKGSDLIFVSHFPVKTRPFYTYPDPDDSEYNQGFDLIGRGVEWLTGGRRIENYEQLISNVKKWKINPAGIDLYLQAFKFGMPPEGGFSFGAERLTQGILGLKNIREATPFPRDMERVDSRLSMK